MKKFILFLFVCTSLHVFAQRKSFFGVNAGINIANQRERWSLVTTNSTGTMINEAVYFQNIFKPTFSVFYQYNFNEKMGLRLNVQYMGLGYKSSSTDVQSVNINYLTLPLTFHYHVNKHLSFNTGPYLSFTIGGTKINNQSITNTYHKNDNGFSFGAEHDIYKNLSLSVNYIFGLKNIWLNDTQNIYGSFGNGPTTATEHTKYTNRALQITLIYKFRKSS